MILERLMELSDEKRRQIEKELMKRLGLKSLEDEKSKLYLDFSYDNQTFVLEIVCKKCKYATKIAILPTESPETWATLVASSVPAALRRFQVHVCDPKVVKFSRRDV